ncbi:hypothetical protein [Nocardia sp. NPDC051832]|uniref:hypothetical protein n=1 Tax=Nocardia sp. NPDC051832 TaxID=3155673 RepID=UPI0034218CA1
MSEDNPNIPAWAWLLEFFEFVVGSDWPAGSIPEIEKIAAELRDVQAKVEAALGPLQQGISEADAGYPVGDGGESIAGALQPLATGDASVEALAAAYGELAGALDDFAGQLYSADVEANINLGWFATELAISYGMGYGKWAYQAKTVVTTRLRYSLLGRFMLRAIQILKTRFPWLKIPKSLVGKIAYEVVQEGLEEVVQGFITDNLVHQFTTAAGYKSDFTGEKAWQNAQLNLVGGMTGGLTGGLLGRRFPMSSPLNPQKWSDAFKGYSTGFAAGFAGAAAAHAATPMVTGKYAEWDWKAALSGANASGLPSAVSGYHHGHNGFAGLLSERSFLNGRHVNAVPVMDGGAVSKAVTPVSGGGGVTHGLKSVQPVQAAPTDSEAPRRGATGEQQPGKRESHRMEAAARQGPLEAVTADVPSSPEAGQAAVRASSPADIGLVAGPVAEIDPPVVNETPYTPIESGLEIAGTEVPATAELVTVDDLVPTDGPATTEAGRDPETLAAAAPAPPLPHDCASHSLSRIDEYHRSVVSVPPSDPTRLNGIPWWELRQYLNGARPEGFADGKITAHAKLVEGLLERARKQPGAGNLSAWVMDKRATIGTEKNVVGGHTYAIRYLGAVDGVARFEVADQEVVYEGTDERGREWFRTTAGRRLSVAELAGGTRDTTVATWALVFHADAVIRDVGDPFAALPDDEERFGADAGSSAELPLHAAKRFFREYADPGGHSPRPLTNAEYTYVAALAEHAGMTGELTWQHEEAPALRKEFERWRAHGAKHAPLQALAGLAQEYAGVPGNIWGAWDSTIAPESDLQAMDALRDRLAAQLDVPASELTADRLAKTIAEQNFRTLIRAGAVEALAEADRSLVRAQRELELEQRYRSQPILPPLDTFGGESARREYLAEQVLRRAVAARDEWARRLGVDDTGVASNRIAETIKDLRRDVLARAAAVTHLADAVQAAASSSATQRFDLEIGGQRLPLIVQDDGGGGWTKRPAARLAPPDVGVPAEPKRIPKRWQRAATRFGFTKSNWLEHYISPEYPFGSGGNGTLYGSLIEGFSGVDLADPAETPDPFFLMLQSKRLRADAPAFWRFLTRRAISMSGFDPARPAITGSVPPAFADQAITAEPSRAAHTPSHPDFVEQQQDSENALRHRRDLGLVLQELAEKHGVRLPDLNATSRGQALQELRYRALRHTAAVEAYVQALGRFKAEDLVLPYRAVTLIQKPNPPRDLERRDPIQQLLVEIRAKLKVNPDAVNPEAGLNMNQTREQTKQGNWWDLGFNQTPFALKLYRAALRREQLKNEVITWADWLGVDRAQPLDQQLRALRDTGLGLSSAVDSFERQATEYEQAESHFDAAIAELARIVGADWIQAQGGQMLTEGVGVIGGPRPRVVVVDGGTGHDSMLTRALADPQHAHWAQALTEGASDLEYRVVRPDSVAGPQLVHVPAPSVHHSVTEVKGRPVAVTALRDGTGPLRFISERETAAPPAMGSGPAAPLPDSEVVARFESAAAQLGVPLIDLAPDAVDRIIDDRRNQLALRALRVGALCDHIAAGSRHLVASTARRLLHTLSPVIQDVDAATFAVDREAAFTRWAEKHQSKMADVRVLLELVRKEPGLLTFDALRGSGPTVMFEDLALKATGHIASARDFAARNSALDETEIAKIHLLESKTVADLLHSDQDAVVRVMQTDPAAVGEILQADWAIAAKVMRLGPEEIARIRRSEPSEVASRLQTEPDENAEIPQPEQDWARLIGVDPKLAFPDQIVPGQRLAASNKAAALYGQFKGNTVFGRLQDSPEQLAKVRDELLAEIDADAAALDTLAALAERFHQIRDHSLFARLSAALINHCVPESFDHLRTQQGAVTNAFEVDPNRVGGVLWSELKPAFRGSEPERFTDDGALGGRAKVIHGLLAQAAKTPKRTKISAWVLERRTTAGKYAADGHAYTVTLLGKNSEGKPLFEVNGRRAGYDGVEDGQERFVTESGARMTLTELAGGISSEVTGTWAVVYSRKPRSDVGEIVLGVGESSPPPSELRIGSSTPLSDGPENDRAALPRSHLPEVDASGVAEAVAREILSAVDTVQTAHPEVALRAIRIGRLSWKEFAEFDAGTITISDACRSDPTGFAEGWAQQIVLEAQVGVPDRPYYGAVLGELGHALDAAGEYRAHERITETLVERHRSVAPEEAYPNWEARQFLADSYTGDGALVREHALAQSFAAVLHEGIVATEGQQALYELLTSEARGGSQPSWLVELQDLAAEFAADLRVQGFQTAQTGALAANHYRAELRSTADIDFLIRPTAAATFTDLADYLTDAGYSVQTEHRRSDGELVLLRVERVGVSIDLLCLDTPFIRQAMDRAADGRLRAEDLIVFKLMGGRSHDADDIRSIMAGSDSLDLEHIRAWSADRGVEQEWAGFQSSPDIPFQLGAGAGDLTRARLDAELLQGTAGFDDEQAGAAYARQYWNSYVDHLAPETKHALMAADRFGYGSVNAALGSGGESARSNELVAMADAAMAQRPVPDTIVVTAGIELDDNDFDHPDRMTGQTRVIPAFLPTTPSIYEPDDIGMERGAQPGAIRADAILHLRVPAGTPAIWTERIYDPPAAAPNLLLPPGITYRVRAVVEDEDSLIHLYADLLPALPGPDPRGNS